MEDVVTGHDSLREWSTQNDYLRQQLAALRQGPTSRWRCFRLHEVVCGGCGDTLAEVMDTEPFLSVLYREMAPSAAEEVAVTPADRMRAVGKRRRRGEWSLLAIGKPVPAEDTDDSRRTQLPSVCRCRQVALRLTDIRDALRRGERKRVLPPASV